MKTGKKTRQLPLRGGLNDLDKSKRTLLDYGKATPIRSEAPPTNIIQNLANKSVK